MIKKFIPRLLKKFYHFTLAKLAAFVYGYPSRKLTVVGITGTGGKSSTVYLLARLLEAAGWNVGATSTVFFKIGKSEKLNDKKMTMLGRFQTQKMLRQMVQAGCKVAIIETTSQGIEQFRHLDIDYNTVVLTNLYPEHIEAHGGFENYKRAKGKLFATYPKTIIVNGDDANSKYFLNFPAENKIKFGLADLQNLKLNGQGIHFVWNNARFNLPILGKFNAYNALCALTIAKSLGLSIEEIAKAAPAMTNIPGRLEFINEGQPFKIIVDYAYEPKAMIGLYETIKMIPHQKVIHVLGSTGGGRDKARRPILGQIVGEQADYAIITDEDPYDEDPREIINQVTEGALKAGKKQDKNLWKILDRREAIAKALALAQAGDLILITGKGAEQAICIANEKKISWDDRAITRKILKNMSEEKSKYPIGSFIDLFTGEKGGRRLRAHCVLQSDGTVICTGDADVLVALDRGVSVLIDGEPRYYQPKDGVKFLLAVLAHFSNPYLFAGEIMKS
ncbi:MAG: UDP-N-acetylmuramoyl-L-alanyl-D-glutamate--2,6-diaminopimelate ligase [Candidatus Magasanikbacteria bacterium]|nr:UDP-N-acetylmuramoyl-L-alanyl-D-glutamate--2,6-diaminopimelate ligase [Candidatus Magasanikbacteria bacterium]